MARPALQVDEDDALGLAEAGAAAELRRWRCSRTRSGARTSGARRDAEDAGAADAEQIAAGEAVAGRSRRPHRELRASRDSEGSGEGDWQNAGMHKVHQPPFR